MSGQKTLTIFNPNSTPFGGQKSQQFQLPPNQVVPENLESWTAKSSAKDHFRDMLIKNNQSHHSHK